MARRTIAGRCGILTGASSGIGRALASQLVREGARLVVVARRLERLQELAASLAGTLGQLEILPGDITESEVRQAAIDRALARFGRLDLLINNAGIGAVGPFADAPEERLRQVMEINFFAPAEMIRQALPALKAGQQPMVVNVGSVVSHRAIPRYSEYCASKFALRGLSEALRAELAPAGIDVLVVSPGTTSTEFFDSAIDTPGPPARLRRAVSSEVVASRTVKAICQGRHEIVIGGSTKLLWWANRLFPRVVDGLMARYG